jgi:hypothetical protein
VHEGYWPVIVSLENPGDPVEGVVELKGSGYDGAPMQIERRVSLARGERASIVLPVPVQDRASCKIGFVAGGSRSPGMPISIRGPGRMIGGGRGRIPVIVVDLGPPDLRQIDAALGGGAWGRGSPLEARHVRPQTLPSMWQPYSSIGLCVIPASVLARLGPAQIQALRQWIVAGGTCLVHAAGDAEGDLAERLGLPACGVSGGSAFPAGVVRRGAGFGECLFQKRDAFPGTEAGWRAILNRMEYGLGSRAVGAASGRFDIPGVGKPPVKAFVLISIIFVILIGPVNWYVVLHRMKRQAFFLVTTPAIAAVVSVLMLAYSFISEGFGTHARVESVAVLDTGSRRGATWSRHAVYAAIPPWGGLRFDPSTLVLPVKPPEGARSVSWDDGQRLTSGWLPARTYTQYGTCAHYPARWRLEVEMDGAGYAVTNGLPRDLTQFLVKTDDGVYRADEVPEGARVSLVSDRPGGGPAIPTFFVKAFRMAGKGRGVLAGLPPGSFVAELDRPLGAELGIESYSEEQGEHFVIGIAGGGGEEF